MHPNEPSLSRQKDFRAGILVIPPQNRSDDQDKQLKAVEAQIKRNTPKA